MATYNKVRRNPRPARVLLMTYAVVTSQPDSPNADLLSYLDVVIITPNELEPVVN